MGEFPDYFTFFCPLMLISCVGTYCVVCVLVQLCKVSRATAAMKTDGKKNYSQYMRLTAFILTFNFIFMWIYIYRIGFSVIRGDVEEIGFAWVECLTKNPSDFETCGERPDIQIDKAAQYGMHLCIAGQGFLMMLAWGTQKDIYIQWGAYLRNCGHTSRQGKSSGGGSRGSTVAGGTRGSSCDDMRSKGPDGVSKNTSSVQMADLDLKEGSVGTDDEGALGDDDEPGGPRKGAYEEEDPRVVPLCGFYWWTERVWFHRRRWEYGLLALLLLLFCVILGLAGFTDEGVQVGILVPGENEGSVGGPSDGGPSISIVSIDFESMDARVLNDTHAMLVSSLVTTARNPCGNQCPLAIEELALDVTVLYKGNNMTSISTERITNVTLLENEDGGTDPIVFRLEMEELMELSLDKDGHAAVFAEFMVDLVLSDSVTIELLGIALASTFGLVIDDIDVNLETSLTGSSGLLSKIYSIDLPGNAPEGGLTITADMDVENPGTGGVLNVLGDIVFALSSPEGVYVGTMLLPNVTLLRGSNPVVGAGESRASAAASLLQRLLMLFLVALGLCLTPKHKRSHMRTAQGRCGPRPRKSCRWRKPSWGST